jgi:nickel-dependent lactate racemase
MSRSRQNFEDRIVQVTLGDFNVAVEVPDGAIIAGHRAELAPNLTDVAAATRSALEQPLRFPPLRRALTPDDHVALVVDERLSQLGLLIEQVLSHVVDAGISPEAITVVSAPGSQQSWVDDLPDTLQDVRTEIHDPASRQAMSYLATTRAGRRIYLNRTVVEAHQTIILAACRYDPIFGCHDGSATLFPAFSDAATLDELTGRFKLAPPEPPGWRLRDEATEVVWLLGVPFMVQIVEGSDEGIANVVGGTIESTPDCEQLLRNRWRVQFERPAQTVVATINGSSAHLDFETLARAALCASRVVEPGGRIVLLTRAKPILGQAIEIIRETDELAVAARRIQERQPIGQTAALLWLEAARHANLYLLSELPEETVEDMFATPLQHARQTQRLLDSAESVLFIDDPHKTLATVKQ